MIIQNKIFIVGVGIILVAAGFVIGNITTEITIKTIYTEKEIFSTTTPITEISHKKTIFDLANEHKPYHVGEKRIIDPIDFINTIDVSIDLAVIHEIETIYDTKNSVTYRVFRVGYDDEPPTYYAGRIIIQTTYYDGTPDYHWSYFVTEIADLNYFGKFEMYEDKLIAECGMINNSQPCTYSIRYNIDKSTLSIEKLK